MNPTSATDGAPHHDGPADPTSPDPHRNLAEQQIQEALAWQHAIIEGSRDAIFVSDTEARFTMVNQAACDLTGYARDELLRMRIPDLHEDTDLGAFRAYHAQIMAGAETLTEARIRRKDGTKVDTEFNNRRVVVGGQAYMHTAARDISERKRTVSLISATLESTADGLLVVDLEGNMVRCNGKFLEMWGLSEQAAASRETRVAHARGLVKEPAGFDVKIDQLYASPEADSFDVIDLKDGRILERVSLPHRVGTECVGRVVSFRDVTAQRQAEQVKTRLLHRLITVQENERRRLARELHDETGQSLTSLLVGLRSIEDAAVQEQVKNTAQLLRSIASQTLEDVGRLAQGLHPTLLDDLGLVPALTRYAQEHGRVHGFVVEVETNGFGPERLRTDVETTLYRIGQEALTNVAKHAAARRVGIWLERRADAVRLTIADDGRGFDPGGLEDRAASPRLGLYGIRERALLLGGSAVVQSQPGQGTRVVVHLPTAA